MKSENNIPTRYFMKNIGRRDRKQPQTPMVDDFELGFSSPICQKGDILVISAIGYSIIMGIYMVLDDKPHTFAEEPEDKWPHKYMLRCMTKNFSEKWWKYNLRTMPLEGDFKEHRLSPDDHIRNKEDSLQIIKWGRPFEINKEFADFVLKRMNEAIESK